MGEIADMMLEGLLCESCGVVIENDLAGEGFPQLCPGCADERRAAGAEIVSVAPGVFQDVTPIEQPDTKQARRHAAKRLKVECPECGKKVKVMGLWQHIEAKHIAME